MRVERRVVRARAGDYPPSPRVVPRRSVHRYVFEADDFNPNWPTAAGNSTRDMAAVSVTNVIVRSNPTGFNAPFSFEITFECLQVGKPLPS